MKDRRISKLKLSILFPVVLAATIIISTPPAYAIPVEDIPASIWRTVKDLLGKTGSQIFNTTLRTAVNQLAYDYATYLGSGASGQKPFFEQKSLGDRMADAGDAAFGQFVEEVATNRNEDGTVGNQKGLNICSPDIFALNKIALGLNAERDDYNTSSCSFRNMKKSWQSEYDQIASIVEDKAYLAKVGKYLDPGGNESDLSAALNYFSKAFETQQQAVSATQADSTENKGWIRAQNLISKKIVDTPDNQSLKAEQQSQLLIDNIGKYTGNVLVDAANIFLNQLALTAFNKLMNNIGDSGSGSSGSSLDQYSQGSRGGTLEIEKKLSTIVEARFSDRTDYDILSELMTCQNPDKPGPTNCVVTDAFATAISNRMSVIDAIDKGYLKKDYSFGFKGLNNEEPAYNQGYPYRSLLILRKYRIIPVGWELAAQFIQKNNKDPNSSVNTQDIKLIDLIRCFDPCDEYTGYNDGIGSVRNGGCSANSGNPQSWCTGLVDPNWVLKVSKMYCGAQGYGPEVQNSQYITEGKFCSIKKDKACVDECSNLGTNYDPSSCCQSGEGTCETRSSLNVTRNQNYCADEQSCIKENDDGSCAYYGYCAEEKRRWIFSENTKNQCEAVNNTCQTFTGNGKTVSYLENTLDFSSCGPNQVGCKQYALNGVYNATNNKVSWNISSGSRYLNNNATSCNSDSEGCHQFIRMQEDGDTNLIADGSFEGSQCINNGGNETRLDNKNLINQASAQTALGTCQTTTLNSSGTLPSPNNHWYIKVNSGSVKAGIVNDQSDHGSQSLYIEGDGGIYSKDSQSPTILPSGFAFENDRFYTLSAMVYVVSGKVRAGFGTSQNGQSAESTVNGSWQNLIVTYYRTSTGANDFYIEATDASAKFYIDAIKLSIGTASTTYSDYFANNVIYEKLLPNYLESVCYEKASGGVAGSEEDASLGTDYRYKATAPAVCYQFARKCNATEVGCVKYKSATTNIEVTGKVKPKDYCPSSCIGYDAFVEQPSYFSASASKYFIPQTARSCNAQAVGCTAFTNLDKLDQGGEAVEYYSYLRTCIKPDTNSCGEFYTWEGSDEAGYQLKVFSLKKNGEQPASTMSAEEEALVCNEDIFKKTPDDIGYNHDCREFYDRNGEVSYHLYSRTISCSDDCHPYRREVASSQECSSGGGTWDNAQNRCVHYAIPGEGTTCSNTEVGCREYTGNIANNTEIVLNDTFENSQLPTEAWSGGTQSNTSLNLGGHSLLGTNIYKIIGTDVDRDQSYTISFLAKAQGSSSVLISGIDFVNKDNQSAVFETSGVNVGTDWKLYSFNLGKLDHEVSPSNAQSNNSDGNGSGVDLGERLRINFAQAVYIDNIKLTKVPDRYYLIKDSWTTPDECDQTVTGAYSPRYMLGCSQYSLADNQNVNLHSFSQLCQDSAAGCEQMINTNNSGDYKAKLYNDTNNNGVCDTDETNCVYIPADSIINVAYDKDKFCGSESKGCSRLGQVSSYVNNITYTDIYKKDDPDTYNTSLCTKEAVGCEAWSSNGGTAYFKDPGNQACEYRLKQGTNSQYEWFKVKVKRCGGTASGSLCSSDSDCGSQQNCSLVQDDILCSAGGENNISKSKTVGLGGRGNEIEQPTNGWAGLCAASQSGCTEYIDPVSKINNNIVFNPTYDDLDKNQVFGDGWSGPDQIIDSTKVEPNTLYILKGAGGLIKNVGNNKLYQLNPSTNQFELVTNDNPFDPVPDNINNESNSTEFFIVENTPGSFSQFTVSGGSWDGGGHSIEIRKAIVGYQLKQNIDRSPTTVDFKTGRVLFNERSVKGSSMQSLSYNADQTIKDSSTGNPPSSLGQLNANVILKVQADRTCDKWLACRSYGVNPDNPNEQTCFDVGLCNSLSPNGECQNFLENVSTTNLVYNLGNRGDFANLTGYTKAGYEGNLIKADMYNIGAMRQVGATAKVPNGSFEDMKNVGWNSPSGSIVYNPSDTQDVADKDSLLPDGKAILKLKTGESATSGEFTLAQNTKYIISAYVFGRSGNSTISLIDSSSNNNVFTPIDTTNDGIRNKWSRKVGVFTTGNIVKYKIKIYSDNPATYFDDIRIEAALNNRCVDSSGQDCQQDTKKWYIPSSCRLYPKADSLSCMYEESGSNITQKGWRGYCLEWDPKNENACLMWYPVDRIISDGVEEGAGITLSSPFNYCTEAKDYCTAQDQAGDKPVVNCSSFAETNINKYWRTRLQANSSYIVPRSGNTAMKVNLGYGGTGVINDSDTVYTATINDLIRDNNYGAYTSSISGEAKVGCLNNCQSSSNAIPLSFFPLYSSLTYNSTSSLCRDDRRINVTQVCGGCQGTGPNSYGSSCNGRTGGCEIGFRDGCKQTEIYTSGNTTRYDDCSNHLPCAGYECWGSTTDGKGRWGYDAFDNAGNSCHNPNQPAPTPPVSCGFYTRQFDVAATSSDQSKDFVKRLFVDGSYKKWNGSSWNSVGDWSFSNMPRCYQSQNGDQRSTYDPATKLCKSPSDAIGSCLANCDPANASCTNDYCYVRPEIFNIRVGKFNISTGIETVVGGAYVDLKFNSRIDPDQLPLVGYTIDWDGKPQTVIPATTLQDGNLYDRPNVNSPHVFKTYLSYQEISTEDARWGTGLCGNNKPECPGKSCCVLSPSLRIEDNWGFYRQINSTDFPVKIVITNG